MKHLSWLVTLVVVLVIAEAALIAAVLVDPDIARTVGNAGADMIDVWAGSDDEEGVLAAYGGAAANVYDNLLVPLWSAPRPDEPDPEFSDCLACHGDYAGKPRSNGLYIDHPLHAALGIGCAGCHTDTAHPNPLPPSEKTCATCHAEVNIEGECGLCHAPGALSHYELLGVPREGITDCSACHLPGSLTGTDGDHLISHSTFTGADFSTCSSCHQTEFCSSCHEPGHGDDWMGIHGQSVAYEGQGRCIACHSSTSCAACHSGAAKQPLPTGGNEG